MISRRVKSRKNYLLKRLRRCYICPSIPRSCCVLLNMGKRLCNKGKANLLIAISERSVYIGYRIDNRYKDSKAYNYNRTYIGLTRL